MKKIEILAHIDTGSPFHAITKNQKVVFTTEGFSNGKIIGLQLKSDTAFDMGDSQIILSRQDLKNVLKLLTEE